MPDEMTRRPNPIRRGARALLCLLGCIVAMAATAAPAAAANGLIVKLVDDAGEAPAQSAQRLQRVLADHGLGGARGRRLGRGSSQHLDFGHRLHGDEAARLAEKLRTDPRVAWVVPNEREHRLQVPQDPLYAASASASGQWWLFPAGGSNTNDIEDRRRGVPGLQAAWTVTTGGPRALVAVLDTGVTAHPDLAAHLLPGRDFVSTVEYAGDGDGWDADPSDPGDGVTEAERSASPALFADCAAEDSSWHGTVIAGLIAAVADNGQGVAGVAWDGRVLPVRVAGKCGADIADIIVGMRWAAGLQVHDSQGRAVPLNPNPARVLNISFGGSAACNPAYQEAIDELAAAGAVVVAAAGNESAAPTRPANCRGVLGVAALNRDGFKSSYSNFGASLAIAAVGGDPRLYGNWGLLLGDDGLLTLGNDGLQAPGQPTYGREAGTSFAAPIVAGVLGLMLDVNPSLSAAQLIAGVRASARPHVLVPRMQACSAQASGRCACSTTTCGAGILDAPQALAYARDPLGWAAPARAAEVVDTPEVLSAVALGTDRPDTTPPAAETTGGGAVDGTGLATLGLALAALLSCRRARSRGPGCPSAGR